MCFARQICSGIHCLLKFSCIYCIRKFLVGLWLAMICPHSIQLYFRGASTICDRHIYHSAPSAKKNAAFSKWHGHNSDGLKLMVTKIVCETFAKNISTFSYFSEHEDLNRTERLAITFARHAAHANMTLSRSCHNQAIRNIEAFSPTISHRKRNCHFQVPRCNLTSSNQLPTFSLLIFLVVLF